jgi:hypothetical protein
VHGIRKLIAEASLPEATVHIVNPGTTYATLCADIYVFGDSHEMSDC